MKEEKVRGESEKREEEEGSGIRKQLVFPQVIT